MTFVDFVFLFLFFLPFFGSVLSSVVPPRPHPHLCAVCPFHPLTHPPTRWGGPGLGGWPRPGLPVPALSLLSAGIVRPIGGQCQPPCPSWSPLRFSPPPPTAPSLLCFACREPCMSCTVEARRWTLRRGRGRAGAGNRVCDAPGLAAPGLGPVKAPSPSLPPPPPTRPLSHPRPRSFSWPVLSLSLLCSLSPPPLLSASLTSPAPSPPPPPLSLLWTLSTSSVSSVSAGISSAPSLSAPPSPPPPSVPSLPLSPSEAQLALAQGPRPGGGRRSHAAHAGQGEPEPALGSVVAGQRRPRGGRDGQAAAAATAAAALPVLGVRAPPQGPPARPARAAPGFVALAQQGPLQQRLRRRRRRRRPRPRARARLRARPRRARETDQGAAPARSAGQHLPVPGRARQARRPGGEELVAQPGPPPALVELQPLALQVPLALRGEEDPQPQPLAVAQENPGPGQGRRRPRKARRGRGRPRPAPLPQLLAHPQAAPGLAQLHGAAAHHQVQPAEWPVAGLGAEGTPSPQAAGEMPIARKRPIPYYRPSPSSSSSCLSSDYSSRSPSRSPSPGHSHGSYSSRSRGTRSRTRSPSRTPSPSYHSRSSSESGGF
ncbi:serine/arginine repetitive matrix protein 3 isoform X2 [Neofelis nebulosa]|uniref:serine/arginine repetitive matrix protein 3 isoform X2 n=1 Tax=Neofelis nebulosa TaxID=61452 RepID=UPI00272D486D|nr:serine/arginine repetitive matrix protein 3 isoform X2 [Neofelis nebulosa]